MASFSFIIEYRILCPMITVSKTVNELISQFKSDASEIQVFNPDLVDTSSQLILSYDAFEGSENGEPIKIILNPEVRTTKTNSDGQTFTVNVPRETYSNTDPITILFDPNTGETIELDGLTRDSWDEQLSGSTKAYLRSTIGEFICEQ